MSTNKIIIPSILLILVMVFAVQNAATVDIRLLFWQVSFPRSLLIFMMLLIGTVVGWFLRGIMLHRSSAKDETLQE